MKTIDWNNGKVVLIDQTLLPLREKYIDTDDYKRVAEAIKVLSVRGAPAIGVAAAYGVALAAQQSRATSSDDFMSDLDEAIHVLGQTRPTAVNLFWALDRMKKKAEANNHLSVSRLKRVIKDEADAIAREESEMSRRIGEYGAELIAAGDAILTHCNAGALATVDYGTALAVIRAAHEQGKNITVYADETRPLLQGARLTTWELMRDKIPVTLICDNMAGYMMKLGRIDKIVVGADRITANGDAANKIGTYSLAVLANYHNVPFYIAAPLSTIDMTLENGELIPIEERSPDEVRRCGATPVAPETVPVFNPSFDVTPHNLITAIITDQGVLTPPYAEAIARLL